MNVTRETNSKGKKKVVLPIIALCTPLLLLGCSPVAYYDISSEYNPPFLLADEQFREKGANETLCNPDDELYSEVFNSFIVCLTQLYVDHHDCDENVYKHLLGNGFICDKNNCLAPVLSVHPQSNRINSMRIVKVEFGEDHCVEDVRAGTFGHKSVRSGDWRYKENQFY